jgi:hypothetical protein
MAGSVFAVSDFMSKLENQGSFAKRNKFTVEITTPNSLISSVHPATIEFLVKTVSFPARSFGSTTYRSGGKFALEVPYEMTEEPIDITFLGTNDWTARNFWNDWIDHIQSVDSYNMKYYKDFIGTVKISVYDETEIDAGNPTHQVTLHEAWPKTIGAIELGWESAELVDFDVSIAYSWWTTTSQNLKGPGQKTPKKKTQSKSKTNPFAITPGGHGTRQKWVNGKLVIDEKF